MFIKHVNIDEYGHLKQMSYSFEAENLIVVYGLNEAGKSTLFHFIETMLFGFSRKKLDVEHYSPANINQYGGSCILELTAHTAIKITRYYKQHKGQPLVAKLENKNNQFELLEERLISQDELERLYLNPLNRALFRDICALTLDELQATSMQEDEQLNQHLYHATWESSRVISQLEKKSSDVLTSLYRPRGSKQQINTLVNEFKQIRDQRYAMENELEAYQAIQTRLSAISQEEQQLAIQKKEQEALQYVLSKAEQDYALRSQWTVLAFEYEQLRLSAIDDEHMLDEISLYLKQAEQQQMYIDELNNNKRKLTLEYEVSHASFDADVYKKQKTIIDQLSYMEPLSEDIEAKQEQLKKQILFVKQKCTFGSLIFDEELVLAQNWTNQQLEQVSNLEETEKQVKQKQLLLEHQLSDTKQKLHYVEEQLRWLTEGLEAAHAQKAEQAYTFIPQQLDDVIRLEASYEEAYRRTLQANELAGDTAASRSRTARKDKPTSILPLVMIVVLAMLIVSALLIAKFNLFNIILSVIVISASGIYAFQTLTKQKNSSFASISSVPVTTEDEFFAVLAQLIIVAKPMNSLDHWTDTQHYQFRQALLIYKQYLKQTEEYKEKIKTLEKDKFEQSHQLRNLIQEHDQLLEQLSTLYKSWKDILENKQLPTSLLFSEVKQFVLDLEGTKDNIVSLRAMSERLALDQQRRDEFYRQVNELAEALQIPLDEKQHYIIEAIKLKYEDYDNQAKLLQQLSLRIEHLDGQLNNLEKPLRLQEASIREHYLLAKESPVEKWRMWLNVYQEMKQLSTNMFQLEQERKAILSDSQIAILEGRYMQQSLEQILQEAALLEESYLDVKQQEVKLAQERGQLLERLKNLSSTSERQMLDQQLLILEEKLAEALQNYTKYALMEYLVSTTREQFEAEHQPALMQQASQYISQLTAGKYLKIVLQPENQTFVLATEQMTFVPIGRLSRGTAELVYFSLRLALLTTHQSLQQAPLILDDPFVNFDNDRKLLVLDFIHQLAKQRQIILLTCHTHILEASQQLGHTNVVHI